MGRKKNNYYDHMNIVELSKTGKFASLRWSLHDPMCPKCGHRGSKIVGTQHHGKSRIRRYQCGYGCGTTFNEYTATFLENSHITATDWLAIYYWSRMNAKNRPTIRWMAKELGITPTTVLRRQRQLTKRNYLPRKLFFAADYRTEVRLLANRQNGKPHWHDLNNIMIEFRREKTPRDPYLVGQNEERHKQKRLEWSESRQDRYSRLLKV